MTENLQNSIFTKILRIRNPFIASDIPMMARLYKQAFDHASLADPKLLYGRKTVARVATFAAYKLGLMHGTGHFSYATCNGNIKSCTFNAHNTQFHAIYFDRFRAGYEPDICAALDVFCTDKTTFYDVGANWGYFTGYVASHQNYAGHIHAFEPHPRTYKDLNRFVHQADLVQIATTYQVAVSDHSGHADIKLPDGMHSGLAQINTNDKSGEVDTCRLDDLRISPPDLIKIDVEGHEQGVLQGGLKKIKESRPVLIFENHVDYNNLQATMGPFVLLHEAGYVFFDMGWTRANGVDCVTPRPSNIGKDSENELVLSPLSYKERPLGRPRINVLALPKERLIELEQKFQRQSR